MNAMIAGLERVSPQNQQLMLIDEDMDIPNPITGEIGRHPEDDGLHMNSVSAEIH